jgi:hypothetical protein
MPDFAHLPPRPFLHRFSMYTGPRPYAYMAEFLNALGYKVFTRKWPEGRVVRAEDVRRFVRRHFSQSPRWPVGRAATQDDYDLIRIDIITECDGEELT